MQIPGFIRGAANRGNKAAQAFVQQYDNGDNTPYDPNAYATVKAQFDDYNGELDDNYEEFDEEEIKSPEEQRANERIDELGEKYKLAGDIDKVKYIKDAYDKGGDEMNKVYSALESRLGADYQMKYEDMNAIPEDVLEDIYNDLYGKNNYPDDYENGINDEITDEEQHNDFRDDYKNHKKMSEEEFKNKYNKYEKDKGGYDYYSNGNNKGYTLSDKEGKTIGYYDLNNGEFHFEDSAKPWYSNLSDESEHAKAYKDAAMKVNPERAALIAKAMDEYVAEKPQRGFITNEQLKKYGERLGLPQMSDRDLRLMWDNVHNVGSYKGYGTPYDKGGRELEDAHSAFTEVVNQEARNRKAKGNYFPYNDEDIESGKNQIRSILSRLDGHDLDDWEGYLNSDELDKIERIADQYHLTADDLAKISPHLDPNGMGYRMKGWQDPNAYNPELYNAIANVIESKKYDNQISKESLKNDFEKIINELSKRGYKFKD